MNFVGNGSASHTTFMIRTAIITTMDSNRPIAKRIGNDCAGFGMFRFATGMFMEATVTQSATDRFDAFSNATARLRPRYRDGHALASGHGYRA